MRMTLKDRFRKDCRQNGWLHPGDTLLIGVSGGADSVCLFLLLSDLREEYGLNLHTICVDHGLRREAQEEAGYVRELSDRLGAVFHTARVDVAGFAEKRHLSIEEAARELRYEALKRCAEEIGAGMRGEGERRETSGTETYPEGAYAEGSGGGSADPGKTGEGQVKIAVAHTRDDQAETVLYRLFRGTGIRGMAGMRAENGRIIRPLLGYSRQEIEEELSRRGVRYYTDASNESDDYARNYIRHHILPEAGAVNERAAAHIAAAAEQFAAVEDYIGAQTREAYRALVSETVDGKTLTGLKIGRKAFLELHPCLQERLLLLAMERLCGHARDLYTVHISELRGLFVLPTGKRLDLPYRMTAVRHRECVELFAPEKAPFYKKGVSKMP